MVHRGVRGAPGLTFGASFVRPAAAPGTFLPGSMVQGPRPAPRTARDACEGTVWIPHPCPEGRNAVFVHPEGIPL